MVEQKRDRSLAGRLASGERTAQRGEAQKARANNEGLRRAERRAERELRALGAVALTTARGDPDFRAKLLSAAAGEVLSTRKIVDIAFNGKLTTYLEDMPAPAAEQPVPVPTSDLSVLPTIAVDGEEGRAVVRYTELNQGSMSEADVHRTIMAMLGASYIPEIVRWACSDPRFPQVMKSISRRLDNELEGLQPEMADRYLTTLRLEKASASHLTIEIWDAMVDWEEIAERDMWAPGPDPTYVFTHHPQGDTVSEPRIFSTLQSIVDAEQTDDGLNELERWNGTWNCDGRAVSASLVRQSIVLARWGVLVSEARARVAKGESARDELKRLRHEYGEARRLEEEKHTVANAMKRRNAKYGPNN